MLTYRTFVMIMVAAAGLGAGVALSKADHAEPSAAQASYVRVCRNHRGVLDRRACHLSDPGRTQLALNLP